MIGQNTNTNHFIIQRSELEGRFDPKSYTPERISFYNKLKENKTTIKLKELIDKGAYGVLPPGDSYNPELPIKFIRATELKEDLNIDFENVHYVNEKYYNERVAIHKGDILLAVKGATIAGKKSVAFVYEEPKKSIFNGSIFRIRVNEKTIPEYVAFMLNSNLLKKQMKYNLVANNAVDYLDKSLISNLFIPLPDKPAQQQIVDLYKTADNAKKQKEQDAQELLNSIDTYLLDELGITIPEKDNRLDSRIFTVNFSNVSGDRLDGMYNSPYFRELFQKFEKSKYNFIRLKKVIKKIKTGTTPSQKYDAFTKENEIVFLRNTNLEKYELNLSDVKYVKQKHIDKVVLSKEGELIMCIAGTVGVSALNTSKSPIAINQNVSSLELNNAINPEFASYWFNTSISIELTKRLCSLATIYYLNNENLSSLPIPLPPKDKQTEIVNHISQLRNRAKKLQEEANKILDQAKATIEDMILN